MNPNHTFYIHKRPESISLDGTWDFTFLPKDFEGMPEDYPYSAVLPASGDRCLEQAGLKPDPYFGVNSKEYAGVENNRWFFQKKFTVKKQDGDAILCFDGVSYRCRVWLNGTMLCEHEGMFGGPVVEVSGYLIDGENTLTVEVISAAVRGSEQARYEIMPWNIIRDSQTSNGDFIVFGIWRPVRLELLPKRRLARPYLYTQKLSDKSAVLHLSCEIVDEQVNELDVRANDTGCWSTYCFAYNNGLSAVPTGETCEMCIRITERENGNLAYCSSETVPLYRKDAVVVGSPWKECQFFEKDIEIENPKLWWPNGLGDAALYDVELTLNPGRNSDTIRFSTGIRTLEFDYSAGMRFRTRWDKFRFIVNGRPFFVKGMNWMPIDYLYDISDRELLWTLELAKNCGIRAIRVWSGGGMPEDDRFYDLCDRFGILVIQDNFIANNTTEKWNTDVLASQVAMNLYRLRCHPSLAVHTGGNEINPYATDNLAAMAVIEREIADLDPARKFWRTSPDKGSTHIYRDMEPVWYRKIYKQLPFIGESGIHSFPNFKSLRQLLPKEEFERPLSDIFSKEFVTKNPALHNHFTEFLPERIPRMMARASMISDIRGISLEDLCEATQMASCEFYQIMIQAMRENYPVNCGVLPWVFRRSWATVAIQLVDGLGAPIAPYYYVKNAYQPLSVFLSLDEVTYAPGETVSPKLCVVCDGTEAWRGLTVPYEILSPDLTVVHSESFSCDITPEEYKKEFDTTAFSLPETDSERYFFFRVRAENAAGKTVSSSFFWCKVLERFRDREALDAWRAAPESNIDFAEGPWLKPQLTALKKQPLAVTLGSTAVRTVCGERRLTLRFTAENRGNTLIFPLKVDLAEDRTLTMADDNFFALDAGASREITMECRISDDTLDCVTLEAGAWNAEPVRIAVKL